MNDVLFRNQLIGILTSFLFLTNACTQSSNNLEDLEFPAEMVSFEPYEKNPIFTGTGTDTWDKKIRERGFILKEDSIYHMWYTGYKNDSSQMQLGYSSSKDGIKWLRNATNPIYTEHWVEDMMVLKKEDTYYMFAEGEGDIAHLLVSKDKLKWEEKGSLKIFKTDGNPISEGPYGTPTAWYERGIWYLFYERKDLGVWLATSKDLTSWKNVQDEPVLKIGPELYDKYATAKNQIVKYKGLYYGYYHASAFKDWRTWTTNVAVSKDLIHWTKYPKNPILEENKSSAILVQDGQRFRLYSMHGQVTLHFNK